VVSFRFKRSCPLVGITQRRLPRAPVSIHWGAITKLMGRRFEKGGAPLRPRAESAPLPVETAPHLRRNRAPLSVGISAPFRPESAQIQLHLATVTGEPKKRAQSAGEEFRSFGMRPPCLAFYKPHDVVRTRLRPHDRAGPETILEEAEDERNVVDDGGLRETTRFPEILLLQARAPFGGSCWVCSDLLGGNRAFTSQEHQQMLQRSRIASRLLYVPKAIFQILKSKLGGNAAQQRLAACKPFAETSS